MQHVQVAACKVDMQDGVDHLVPFRSCKSHYWIADALQGVDGGQLVSQATGGACPVLPLLMPRQVSFGGAWHSHWCCRPSRLTSLPALVYVIKEMPVTRTAHQGYGG